MILVIDTASARSALAVIYGGGRFDELTFNVRETPIPMQFSHMVKDASKLTRIAVSIGPGSFTGLRVGVSFGLGLAIGLRIPIVPLPTLDLYAARSDQPVTSVVEAGRGRYYFREPAGETRLGTPTDIPSTHDLVGNVADGAALVAAGHRFKPEKELRRFVEAADILLRTAPEVPYRNLEISYMQSFSARKV